MALDHYLQRRNRPSLKWPDLQRDNGLGKDKKWYSVDVWCGRWRLAPPRTCIYDPSSHVKKWAYVAILIYNYSWSSKFMHNVLRENDVYSNHHRAELFGHRPSSVREVTSQIYHSIRFIKDSHDILIKSS